MTINAQDKEHDHPEDWSPLQVLNFTFFPRINDAFAKPLYTNDTPRRTEDTATQNYDDPLPEPGDSDTDTDVSVMDVTSLEDSSSQSEMNIDEESSIDSI